MKKRFSLIILCFLFVFMLASCNALVRNKNSNTETPPVETNDGYKVLFVTEYGEEVETIEKIKKLPELPKLDEQGYNFLGWSYDKDSKDFAKKDDEVKKDITLYAIWEQITYSITYDANGHGTAPSKVENTLELPTPLPTMEEEGFEFLGWSRIKNSKYLVKEGDKINSNVVLYGIWQSEKIEDRSYTVSYYSAYGDTPDAETNVTTLPNELPLLEDDEYIFLGWTYDRLTNELVKPGEPIESDVRLYAVWGVETHTISFDAMGYGIAPKKITSVLAIPDELPTMKYDGCVFLGWSMNPNTNVLVETGTEISTDIKLYAVWEETGFNISYVANGHGTAPKDDFSSRIPDPLPTMEEEGYTFEGWSEYEMSTKLVRPGDKLTKDITLYGIWKKKTYRITYHNNGRGTTPDEEVGVTKLPDVLPTMTVDGYEFIGWSKTADSTETVPAGANINYNVDLYAIWKQKTYNIKYYANGHGTAPSPTLGATKLPNPLPKINDTDNYGFQGWAEDSDSSTLVQAGKEIYEDLILYAVWVSKEAYVTSIDLTQNSKDYIKTDKLDSNDIDTDLAKIVYVATYSDGTEVEIKADKSMLSNADYEALKTSGKHEVTFTVLGVDLDCILYTEYYWLIAYYSKGELYQQAYKFMDGANANTPQKPKDYLDENNVLWTFDKWSESDEEVHKHMNIEAVFKKVILFDYYVTVNSSSEATIVFSYDKTRVTSIDMRIIDNDTKALIYQIIDLEETYELTSLAKDVNYKITGTYAISYNDFDYDLDINASEFTTRLVSDLDDIEYQIDTRGISNHSISLDISQYAEGAPLGYSLYKVYLLDLEGKLVGEFNYTKEDTIAYFDGLEPDTEYQTMFYYCEIKDNSSSAMRFATIPSYEIEFKPEYGFAFRGFNVFTSSRTLEHKEVRLIYNDPVRGKKVFYRYYVSEGGSVPYRTYEYSNPFTFALPTIYNEYYAFGDYSELKNITEDKEVEVYLVRKYWYESSSNSKKHTVIFVGYSDKNRWEENQYIISVQEIEDGGTITLPTNLVDYDAYLPDETDKYSYEPSWETGIYYSNIDLTNVTHSGVVYSRVKAISKNTVTVYDEPELRVDSSDWWPSLFVIGPDYVILDTSIFNTSAIIKSDSEHVVDGITAYLTEGALNSNGRKIETAYIGDYSDCFVFNDLDGIKYVAHIVFQYDTNDGTGVHTMHYAIPFALQEEDYNTNISGSSPNYHTIEVVNSNYSEDKGFTLIPNDLNGKTFARYYLMNNSKREKNTYRYLNTNRTYNLYTFDVEKSLSVYKKIDEEERIFTTNDCIFTEGVQHIVSKTYQTITTKDGIEPTSIVLEVPCENHTLTYTIGSVKTTKVYNLMLNYNEVDLSMYRLRIGNYTEQVDIGPINLEFYVHYREYGNDPQRNGEQFVLNFEFDSELGYYTCTGIDDIYSGYEWRYEWKQRELYQAFFHTDSTVNYSIHIQMYYNGYSYHSIYFPDNNTSTVENTNHGPNESYIYYYPYKITRYDN